jgi:membrane-associated phospholipid phosphatase
MDTITIIIASYFIAIPLSVILYQFFVINRQQRLRLAAVLVAGGIISLLLAKIGHVLIQDPRPFLQGHFNALIVSSRDNGFPSDHVLLAAFIAFVMLGRSRVLGSILLVVALAVGLARMAAGVHHSWDVLGSFVIAGAGYVLARTLVEFIAKRRSSKET